MSAKNGFAFSPALTKLEIQALGKRRQTVFQPRRVFGAGGNGPIDIQTVAFAQRQHSRAYPCGQHVAVQQVRIKTNQRARQRVCRQLRCRRLNAITVNKAVLDVLLQRTPGLFGIAAGNVQTATIIEQRAGANQR